MAPPKSLVGATALAGAVLAAALSGVPSAGAAPATAQASIRGAHFSPDTPGVDIYLTSFSGRTSRLWVSDETYGGVSGYSTVAPGLYTVSMRAHGASATGPAVLSWTLDARAGRAYTAAAVGTGPARKGVVLDDDLTPPAPGTGRVRLIQAASVAPKADVVAVHGPVLADGAAFATSTGYAQVPAGTWPLLARSATSPAVSTSARVSVASGSVTSVLLLDAGHGSLAIRTVLDAAGAGAVPQGAVPAGGGGTAGRGTPGGVPAPVTAGVGGAGAGVLALAGLAVASRRRRTGAPRAR